MGDELNPLTIDPDTVIDIAEELKIPVWEVMLHIQVKNWYQNNINLFDLRKNYGVDVVAEIFAFAKGCIQVHNSIGPLKEYDGAKAIDTGSNDEETNSN
jgi:hypothetical protein